MRWRKKLSRSKAFYHYLFEAAQEEDSTPFLREVLVEEESRASKQRR